MLLGEPARFTQGQDTMSFLFRCVSLPPSARSIDQRRRRHLKRGRRSFLARCEYLEGRA